MASASHVTIRKRAALLFLFVVVVMAGLIGRLGYLQFFRELLVDGERDGSADKRDTGRSKAGNYL